MRSTADVVVCGAGIAGVAAAYHLAVRHGVRRVVLVDERDPLTLTSDKGTQGYRNWWPGPDDTMLRLVSRSIDLLEETATECGNAFRLNRHGYLFATADEAQVARLETTANEVSSFGMGPLRTHPGNAPYQSAPRRRIRRSTHGRGPVARRRGAPRISVSRAAIRSPHCTFVALDW